MSPEHEHSVFNQKKAVIRNEPEAFLALPDRPLNRHEARQMLEALLEQINNDLVDSEKQEFEQLMADYGEKWFL